MPNIIAMGTTDTAWVDVTGPATIHVFTGGERLSAEYKVDVAKKNSDGTYTVRKSLGADALNDYGSLTAGVWGVRRRAGAACAVDKE